MNSLINYERFYGAGASNFNQAKTLKELEGLYGDESLINIQHRLTNQEILDNNANLIKMIEAPYNVTPMKGKVTEVDDKLLKEIYDGMEYSEVNKNHWCYDTKGTIGFCFGRATIAHMEAISRDVHPDLVKKVWIAGDMGVWGHHVATLVYTKKGWMVLDTNQGRPYTFRNWLNSYLPMKKGKKDIMAFVTQAGRFGPEDGRPYNPVDLFNTHSDDFNRAEDFFKGYFFDYYESLDNRLNKPLHVNPGK